MAPVAREAQDPTWSTLLADGKYEQAGQVLGAIAGKTSFEELGRNAVLLLRLDLPSARLALRGMKNEEAGQSDIAAILEGLIQSHRGDPMPLVPRIQHLLEDPSFRLVVLPYLGRGALQLCRSGRQEGVDLLQRILVLYPKAEWALSNLANGHRFMGQYEKALEIFDSLLENSGRQAWFLNGKALVHQARFETEKALALFLEGGDEKCPGSQADRFTNRTNAAVFLMARREVGDLVRAEQLLESVVSRDPAAIRAPYYLRRVQRLRSGLTPR